MQDFILDLDQVRLDQSVYIFWIQR